MLERRTFLRGVAAVAGATLIGRPASAAPLAFDPAAYVADLRAIGCEPFAFRSVSLGGVLGSWSYGIHSPEGRGFGREHLDLMAKWHDVVTATPDLVDRVAAYIAGGAP